MTDNDADANEITARDGRCWDLNWMVAGLDGMFIDLDMDDFVENEMLEFEDNQEVAGGSLIKEHEFLNLETMMGGDEDAYARLHMEVIKPRKLRIADGVSRRIAEGSCPPRIRIRSLSKAEMDLLLEAKQKGNEAFCKEDYGKALEYYDEALSFVGLNLFVAPEKQVEQVVNILSNQAECYLRLKRFQDAGKAATNALLFINGHEKSRLRRAKAALAIAGTTYLIQAQVDLEEIVTENYSKAGVAQAKEYLEEMKDILALEQNTFKKRHPDTDWDFYVRLLISKCW